jgi:hypothetical protein
MNTSSFNNFESAVLNHAANEFRIANSLKELETDKRIGSAWKAHLKHDLVFREVNRILVDLHFDTIVKDTDWATTIKAAMISYEAALASVGLREFATFTKVIPWIEPNPFVSVSWIIQETVWAGVQYKDTSVEDRPVYTTHIEELGRAVQQFAYHRFSTR